MNRKKIVITHCPLNVDKDSINNMVQNNELLTNAIKSVSEKLSDNGIEIFSYLENLIVTENGYYFAFFEKDLTLSK